MVNKYIECTISRDKRLILIQNGMSNANKEQWGD